jgi:general secretion pathway protein I
MRRRGFTLLEVIVATLLMAVAVTGVLGALRVTLANAARLTDNDRLALLARRKLDELLATRDLPKGMPFEGLFAPEFAGGQPAGWTAVLAPFELSSMPPAPGQRMLERIELSVWCGPPERRRTLRLEAFRTALMLPADVAAFGAQATAAQAAGEQGETPP